MLLALSASTAGAATQCRLSQLPPIPVTMLGWRPTIPAQLDGHRTRLLVDTGAFFDALSPAEATEFNLSLSAAPPGLYVTGGLGDLYPKIATVRNLRLGPLSFSRSAIFLVMANDLGDGISGVLGQNLFQVLDVEFDFANGVMRFFRVKNCGQRPLAYWAEATGQSVSVLDLEQRDPGNPHLLATVQVNGHAVHAIFDTGATTSMLSLGAAELVGVSPGGAGVTPAGTSGKLWSAPIEEIDLGDNEKIEHTHILVADRNFYFGPGVWMYIGADFFLSHRVYLATSQSKLYFTYSGGPVFDLNPAHAAHDRAGAPSSAGLPAGSAADAEGLLRRGLVQANQLQFRQALADLTQACQLAPENADCRYQRGLVQWRDGQPDQALADLSAAIALDPNDFRARLSRAQLRLGMRAPREPDPRSQDAGAPDPKVVDDSRVDLDAVDRLASPEADVRLTLGRVYEDIGGYAQAVRQYDLWINYHGEDDRLATALTWRCGSRARSNSDLDQALRDCNRAYGLMGLSWWSFKPKWPPQWCASLLGARSLIHLRQGNLKGAIDDDDDAIKLEPKDAYALYARGLAELREGSKMRGQSDLAAARKLQPDIDQRYATMGLTH